MPNVPITIRPAVIRRSRVVAVVIVAFSSRIGVGVALIGIVVGDGGIGRATLVGLHIGAVAAGVTADFHVTGMNGAGCGQQKGREDEDGFHMRCFPW